jgi:hypothetical protein
MAQNLGMLILRPFMLILVLNISFPFPMCPKIMVVLKERNELLLGWLGQRSVSIELLRYQGEVTRTACYILNHIFYGDFLTKHLMSFATVKTPR